MPLDFVGGFFLLFVWNFFSPESNQKIPWHTPFLNHPDYIGSKTTLMNSRTLINKTIILSVFVLAGWLLARSFYYGSFIGIVLALVGIAAWAFFLYKLTKLQTENDPVEEVSGDY